MFSVSAVYTIVVSEHKNTKKKNPPRNISCITERKPAIAINQVDQITGYFGLTDHDYKPAGLSTATADFLQPSEFCTKPWL